MAWRLKRRLARQRLGGKWEYNLVEAEREEAGFDPMETNIWQRQNKVAQYIAPRLILDLCQVAERKRGSRAEMQWWEPAEIDLPGAREMEAAEAEADNYGLEE